MFFGIAFGDIWAVAVAALAIFYGVVGVLMVVSDIRLRWRGVVGTALVVAMHDGFRCRYPEIEFIASTGRRVRTTVEEGAMYAGWEPGNWVRIRYDPGDPERVEFSRRVVLRTFLELLAICSGPVGVWLLISHFAIGG